MATSLPSSATEDKRSGSAGGSQGSGEDPDSFDLTGHHPTRDTLAEGIVSLLSPTLRTLDEGVLATKRSQEDLAEQIALLTEQLQAIAAEQSCPIDLNGYVTRLGDIKGKINVISSVLHSAQDRLNKVHEQAVKETTRRKPLLEPAPASISQLQGTKSKKVSASSDEDSDADAKQQQLGPEGGLASAAAGEDRSIPSPLTDPLTDSSPSY